MTDGSGSDRPALGLFEAVRGLSFDAPFPEMLHVRQRLAGEAVADVPAATAAALEPLRSRVTPGMSVAVTAGSRGIHDMVAVLRAAGAWLQAAGARPFVVPAMGSHGGATAEGQVAMLEKLGITPDSVGMPIRATMDTVRLGALEEGPEVHLDRHAAGADGILVVNRVKPHTDFHGPVESGLAKITAIGLGKQRGAEGMHAFGPAALARWIPAVARRIVETGKILGGLAIVENGYHHAARIALLEAEDIAGPAEEMLLRDADRLMGRLPFDEIDVLVVDVLGKDKSGSGLDPNVVGRMMIRGTAEPDRPRIANVVVLDVTDASRGNATGLGLADFTTFRLLERVDLYATYINSLTSGLGGVQRAQIPVALATDRDAVAAALRSCGRPDPEAARVVRVHDTLAMADLQVSAALEKEVTDHPALEVVTDIGRLTFDAQGTISPWQ